MSIGRSGRVVIEIDPALKRELHSILARKGMTLKDWFVAKADDCISTEARSSGAKRTTPASPLSKKGC